MSILQIIMGMSKIKPAYWLKVDSNKTDFQKKKGTNSYVLAEIENGYTILFYSMPAKLVLKNNKPALSNADFVEEAINYILKRGLVVKCGLIRLCVNLLCVSVQLNGKDCLF